MCKTMNCVLTAAMIVGLAIPSSSVAAAKKAPKLSNKKISIKVGEKKTIKVKNTTKKVKWSVKSGKKYVTLSNVKRTSAVVKGTKAGSTVVTAKIGKTTLNCKVTVSKKAVKVTPKPDATQTVAPTAEPTVEPSVEPSQPAATEKPAAGDPTPKPTATPGPTYAPEKFKYEGLDQTYLDSLDPKKPTVAFTFDDGPVGNSEDSNSMIIQKALKDHGAHATFFYIGTSINSPEKEDEIRQAAENGFEVGNHSWGWDSVSSKEAAIKESIGKTNEKLSEITGYSNFLFRAPNLAINDAMKGYIKAPFINCSVDSKDWTGADAATIYENVTMNAPDGGMDGGIVLMHEFNTKTYEAINGILDKFIEEGYQVVSVSELFAIKGKELVTGTVYSSAN